MSGKIKTFQVHLQRNSKFNWAQKHRTKPSSAYSIFCFCFPASIPNWYL